MKDAQTAVKKHAPHTLPPAVINLFFAIGLISALCFRALMAVKDFQPQLFRAVWYVGIIGYVLFFSFRYSIAWKRKKTISDYNLISKVEQGHPLSPEDREALSYLLSSLQKSRESLNYLFIFATSVLAILLDLTMSM
ncbi:MAG: hypothetical protein BM485_00200 [Desulfobulbaceae bacterium DB1]|nr:MAG: hypothetical protein BM485_00200 [Desulfobulbaceae bacterium DB1]